LNATLPSDLDISPGQFGRLQVAIGRAKARINEIIASHVRHTRRDFLDRHVIDIEANRLAHLDQRRNLCRAFGCFGNPQRACLNENLDARELLQLFDNRHAVDQHPRVLDVASQLAE